MKTMFKELTKQAKENPLELISSAVFLIGVFACLYAALWISAALTLNGQ